MQHAKSKTDVFYRRFIVSTFFANGWGDVNAFKRLLQLRELLGNRSTSFQLVSRCHPVQVQRSWSLESHFVAQGQFTSPVVAHVPDLLPRESEQAHFEIVVPKKWHRKNRKPLCLHLAGTGDHFFWRRRNLMAKPLAKESGIASIILESPYYGLRKPKGQTRSSLRHVLDLFVMGAALMLEALVLFHWSEREGFGPLGVSGISMGGHMASLAATTWPKPLAVVPCLSWSTASCVFTQGVMRHSCAWDKLEQQLSDESYGQKLMDLFSPDWSAEHIFQSNTDGALQSYPYASFSTVPIEDLTKSQSLYQRDNQADLSKTFYSSEENSVSKLRDNVFQNIPRILKPSTEKLFSPPPSQAVSFMNFVMDKVTHLQNLQKPFEPSLAKFLVAEHDAYVPRDKVADIKEVWPGCEMEYINSGHVAGSLIHQATFRKAITQVMNRL